MGEEELLRGMRVLGFLLLITLSAIPLISLVCAICADGKPGYCYLQIHGENKIALVSHRSWREDFAIGFFPSVEEANKEAINIKCPLR